MMSATDVNRKIFNWFNVSPKIKLYTCEYLFRNFATDFGYPDEAKVKKYIYNRFILHSIKSTQRPFFSKCCQSTLNKLTKTNNEDEKQQNTPFWKLRFCKKGVHFFQASWAVPSLLASLEQKRNTFWKKNCWI